MRSFIAVLLITFGVICGAASAQFEITADDMRDIEDTFKSLDSNVVLKDKKAAAEARELVAYFQKVEGHYATQPDKASGVGFARKTHELASQLAAAVEAGNFDAASEAASQLPRSCKACHDVYKGP